MTWLTAKIGRRGVLAGGTGLVAAAMTSPARATVPVPYDWSASPPMTDRAQYIDWMVKNRGEDPGFLGARFDRLKLMLAHHDLWDNSVKRAYLMTPREEFVLPKARDQTYVSHFLDIGFGVTITGPNTVCRMTNTLAIKRGEKVLEIGTGSGYQSAILSNLTDQVHSIEIIPPLAARTRKLYEAMIAKGYSEYRSIIAKTADGYYGWAEAAPFDKMIVTCGIDHVPPPLLKQLKPGGIMVIPIGPPGSQHVLKVVKQQAADGSFTVTRSDIYNGGVVNFVPFTGQRGKNANTHSSTPG